MRHFIYPVLTLLAVSAVPATAHEIITYTYDARGRLIKAEHSGTVNNNLKAEYALDKADNRTNVKVTGSPNN